jgi:hypothetical protein
MAIVRLGDHPNPEGECNKLFLPMTSDLTRRGCYLIRLGSQHLSFQIHLYFRQMMTGTGLLFVKLLIAAVHCTFDRAYPSILHFGLWRIISDSDMKRVILIGIQIP